LAKLGGFLVYDFNRMANTATALAGAVIMLAIALYLDIFNLFLNLLTILRQGCAVLWARSGPPGARHRHRLGHRRADLGEGPVLLHERGGRHPAGGAGAYDHHVDLLGSGSRDDHLLGRHAMRHRGDVVWADESREAHEMAMANDPHRGRQVRLAVGAEGEVASGGEDCRHVLEGRQGGAQ
jgi:hypothetical protein